MSDNLEQVTISLPRNIVDRLKAEASANQRSVAFIVRRHLLAIDAFRSADTAVDIHDVRCSVPAGEAGA
jgi:hypothetical protein